jgi:membrane associated rhomboid family serine protease
MRPREVNVTWFIGRGPGWLVVSLFLVFGVGVFVYLFKFPTAKELALMYGAAFLLALFAVICAFVAIRYFHPWYSWLWFVPPIVPLFLLIEPIRTGEISIAHFMHVIGLAGVFVYIALHAYQRWRNVPAK